MPIYVKRVFFICTISNHLEIRRWQLMTTDRQTNPTSHRIIIQSYTIVLVLIQNDGWVMSLSRNEVAFGNQERLLILNV